ncbi:DinB family protein [Rubrivirga sp.]|uniref:DinB family protein n=1 Tax=Rubrivirga sp. TaxID=1885344 RepID=UPI003B527AEE
MADPRIATHLLALDRAFDGRGWHGPTLLGAARGLDEAAASWRPAPDAHNAWEYLAHAAYWTYRVLRHVAADPPARFDEPGSDFFARPAEGRTLADDLDRLVAWHGRLVEAVHALDPARLDAVAYDDYTVADLLAGIAAHDAYHAGQIRLLRRLHDAAPDGT